MSTFKTRKNFYMLEDAEKRIQVKRGINFFMQFFRAIPPESIQQMTADDLVTLFEFLNEQKVKVGRELDARRI
jgi:hypothetical protein